MRSKRPIWQDKNALCFSHCKADLPSKVKLKNRRVKHAVTNCKVIKNISRYKKLDCGTAKMAI